MRSNRAMWPFTALVVLALLLLVWRVVVPPPPTVAYAPRPECPAGGAWRGVFQPDSGLPPFGPTANGLLTLPGMITEIVEYHDCQQFIVPDDADGHLRYTSLFAIFARSNLDSTYVAPGRAQATFDPQTMGTPMAQILAYDSAYAPLGIAKGFNCLYFFRNRRGDTAGYQARVVPVQVENECGQPLQPADTRGTTLAVTTVISKDVPPPVTRWDWDSINKQQYIGIRCGTEWCEVHPNSGASVVGATFNSSRPLPPLAGMAKGWYDEQILTLAETAPIPIGTPAPRPQVSAIVGTLIPEPNLGRWSGPPATSRFSQGWTPVAQVAIRGNPGAYTSKFNLIESGEDIATNIVFLCYAGGANPDVCEGVDKTALKCATDAWYTKIVHNPNSPAPVTKYFCTTRRGHDDPGMPAIPGVVRWRWLLNDETMWVRCLQGCCEVNAT
jgi:hypothetical protein